MIVQVAPTLKFRFRWCRVGEHQTWWNVESGLKGWQARTRSGLDSKARGNLMKKHKVKLISKTLSWSHNHQSFSGYTDAIQT